MPGINPTRIATKSSQEGPELGHRPATGPSWGRFIPFFRVIDDSISAKLILLLIVAMVLTFATAGYINIRLHRAQLENSTLASADSMSDVIKRSTSYYMMRNDRYALYEMMSTMADEPGVVRLRVINPEGRISFSTDPNELDKFVDKGAEQCYGCHKVTQPLSKLNRPDRFRIYRSNGKRILAIITPIDNSPACSNAACHAHPASQQVLGVLDTNLSLAAADRGLAASTRAMLASTVGAVVFIALVSFWFVWHVVHKPLSMLQAGTERLSRGELGYQINVHSNDETGRLAVSFNQMSTQLLEAQNEITAWTRTLETRVEEKTSELKRAHDQMLHVERMVAIGKMSAVVAHEINNPLAGILTYAKLIKKWLGRGLTTDAEKKEAAECLDLIAAESRRCGDLVKNLLQFSRTSPLNMDRSDLNIVIDRCIRLVQHKIDLQGIQLQVSIATGLPLVYCDGAQIEQVMLALMMNAIDAMPHGGNLWVSSRQLSPGEVELQVRDDGMGIPPELLSRLFEPFTTTKEVGKGVGLGLAVSKGIVERHGGRIELQSDLGVGTTFRVILPLDARISDAAKNALAAART